MEQLPCMSYKETLRHLYSPSFTILSIINLNQMKNYYKINMVLAVLFSIVTMFIPVLGFMTMEPTAVNLAIICFVFTTGALGSYMYYDNAQKSIK
jgi:hypothetical protein